MNAKKSLGLIFVDLQKAYDSVDRLKLWDAMSNELGVPKSIV